VPEHKLAGALWSPIGCEGLTAQMMHGNGMGFNWEGQYDVSLLDKHAQWRDSADASPHRSKICMFVGQYGLERYHGRYYARAQNIARRAAPATTGRWRLRPAGDAHRACPRSAIPA
jgi:amidase